MVNGDDDLPSVPVYAVARRKNVHLRRDQEKKIDNKLIKLFFCNATPRWQRIRPSVVGGGGWVEGGDPSFKLKTSACCR